MLGPYERGQNVNELAVRQNTVDMATFEQVVVGGDLSKLSASQRVAYYQGVCKSLGLNPLTKPFSYITLNGRLTLYATRDATDQLRRLNNVSCRITAREFRDDVYIVTAQGYTAEGRADESTGVVTIGSLKGDALCNALMKAETKAKRRVTLSIVGLGWLDETETETVPDAKAAPVDTETGEILDNKAAPPSVCVDCKQPILARQTKHRLFTAHEIETSSKERYERALCWNCALKAREAGESEGGDVNPD